MAKPGPKPQLRLSDALGLYLDWHRGEHHAKNTIEKAQSVITNFISSTGDLMINNVRRSHVTDWRTARGLQKGPQGKALSKGTLNNDRIILGTFFKWCRDNGHFKGVLPTEGMRKLKGFDNEHLHLPRDEWAAFLDACENPRDRWHAAVGFYTGARAVEMSWMTLSSLKPMEKDGHSGIVIVRWKTYEIDHMVMVDELQEECERWMAYYRKQLDSQGIKLLPEHKLIPSFQHGSGAVVQGRNGQFQRSYQLVPTRSPQRAEPFVHKVLAKLGYVDTLGEGLHLFRRSAALVMLQELEYRVNVLGEVLRDPPMRIVMNFLNHKDQRQTEKYLGREAGKQGRDDAMRGRMIQSREAPPVETEAPPVVSIEHHRPIRHLSVVRSTG